MSTCRSISVLAIGVAFFWSASAHGQLFGDVSLNPNKRIEAQNEGLNITGAERFIRGNRTAGDFVGAAADNLSQFVGAATDAAGPTVTSSAVTGLTEAAAPRLNVNRTRRTAGIYDERLQVDFDYPRRKATDTQKGTATGKTDSVSAMWQLLHKRGIELTLSADGTTARLQGTARSSEQRRLAELVVLFEPGISTVRNELQLAPVLPE